MAGKLAKDAARKSLKWLKARFPLCDPALACWCLRLCLTHVENLCPEEYTSLLELITGVAVAVA